jgi:5-methylcytosine-specific restriction endonuclease McrA
VRERDKGVCQFCGKKGNQAHHIYSRRHYGTRWIVSNGVFLCAGCHLFIAHRDYERFRDRVIELYGEKTFEWLKHTAYQVVKLTVDDLERIKDDLK